jgi:hypothetical protein
MSDPRFKPSSPEIQFPNRNFDGVARAFDNRGVLWEAQIDSLGLLTVNLVGSRSPFPVTMEYVATDYECIGTPSILYDQPNSTMVIACPLVNGGKLRKFCLVTDFPDPSATNNSEYIWKWVCLESYMLATETCASTAQVRFRKGQEPLIECTNCKPTPIGLTIINRVLHYHGKPIILVGNSARQVLTADLGLVPKIPWTLGQYEKLVKDSGINYVRHDTVDAKKHGAYLREHCLRMQDLGVVIELTLSDLDGTHPETFGYWKDTIDIVGDLDNIIFNDENELNHPDYLIPALEKAHYLVSRELWCIGGGYGNNPDKGKIAYQYLLESPCQIVSMHRPYPPIEDYQAYIEKLKAYFPGKPILESEFLKNTAQEFETYANIGLDAGLQGFNCYGDQFVTAGRICKERNNG